MAYCCMAPQGCALQCSTMQPCVVGLGFHGVCCEKTVVNVVAPAVMRVMLALLLPNVGLGDYLLVVWQQWVPPHKNRAKAIVSNVATRAFFRELWEALGRLRSTRNTQGHHLPQICAEACLWWHWAMCGSGLATQVLGQGQPAHLRPPQTRAIM